MKSKNKSNIIIYMGNYTSFYKSEQLKDTSSAPIITKKKKERVREIIINEDIELDSNHYYNIIENKIIYKYGANYKINDKFIWREKLGNYVELIFGKIYFEYKDISCCEKLIILKQKNYYYTFEFDYLMEIDYTKLFNIKTNYEGVELNHKDFEPIIIKKHELRNKFRRKKYLINSIKNGLSYIC
jgi:hypothetical protein